MDLWALRPSGLLLFQTADFDLHRPLGALASLCLLWGLRHLTRHCLPAGRDRVCRSLLRLICVLFLWNGPIRRPAQAENGLCRLIFKRCPLALRQDGGLPLQLLFQFGNIAVTLEILQGALGQILQALPDKGSKFLFQLEAVCLRGLLEQGRDTVRVGAVGL